MASLKVVSIQRAMPGLDSPLQMPCQARVGTGQMKDEEVRRMGLRVSREQIDRFWKLSIFRRQYKEKEKQT